MAGTPPSILTVLMGEGGSGDFQLQERKLICLWLALFPPLSIFQGVSGRVVPKAAKLPSASFHVL